MGRILRIISTAVIAAGLCLLFLYLHMLENTGKELALLQPSYYVIQNYLYIFLAGAGCVIFSVISSFLAWNKALDKKVEILPNAIAADKGTVESWLTGSSLDTKHRTTSVKSVASHELEKNEVPTVSNANEDKTERTLDFAQTVLQSGDTQTLLAQEKTILENSEDTILEESTYIES